VLPLRGFPIRYPCDRYDVIVAVALQRVYPDGRIETLSPEQTPRHLSLSLQELLPSLLMSPPEPVDPESYYLTAVDLSLSIIILFLLGGLTVKALIHAHDTESCGF
jgi:hypothetical protein